MDPNVIIAAIAALVLLGIAGIVGMADLRHQRRVARINAAIVRNSETITTPPIIAGPRPVRGRWS
jgi:Flp pilus assembly protein CpaB